MIGRQSCMDGPPLQGLGPLRLGGGNMTTTEFLVFVAYLVAMLYSGICAPDIFFRIRPYRPTPEYVLAFFLFCFLASITLVSGVARLVVLAGRLDMGDTD